MKFLHTADLHLGKMIYEFSMLEDQKYILEEILEIARKQNINGFLLAGDIYDRSVPSTEAIQLLDWFLQKALKIAPVFMIAGNHDGAKRMSFASQFMEGSGLYIVGGRDVKEVLLQDAYGTIAVHMLPFVKPAVVGAQNSEEAVKKQLQVLSQNWEQADRHMILSHFFVCAGGKEPELSDSENPNYVGGLEQVDVSLFAGYEYVALGHIHKPQCMKQGQTYYAGSPLSYSFSECHNAQGVQIVTLEEKGSVKVERMLLHPRRNMRILRGSLQEILQNGLMEAESGENKVEDYIQAILTDRDELIDPMGSLRSVYPNTMQIILEKRFKEGNTPSMRGQLRREKSTLELFSDFYEELTGEVMDEARVKVVTELAAEVEEKSI